MQQHSQAWDLLFPTLSTQTMETHQTTRSLQQQQEHICETDQMPAGRNHGVVPKGVDRSPGEEVSMIFTREPDDLLGDRQFLTKKHAAP